MLMNMSIGCYVKSCKYHHLQEDYCTLEHIQIEQGSHQQSFNCTDCKQFKKK